MKIIVILIVIIMTIYYGMILSSDDDYSGITGKWKATAHNIRYKHGILCANVQTDIKYFTLRHGKYEISYLYQHTCASDVKPGDTLILNKEFKLIKVNRTYIPKKHAIADMMDIILKK